jgi:hypothetical protein
MYTIRYVQISNHYSIFTYKMSNAKKELVMVDYMQLWQGQSLDKGLKSKDSN